MRTAASNVTATAWAADHPNRPVRLKIGSSAWSMSVDEAVQLAAGLVAAVDAARKED